MQHRRILWVLRAAGGGGQRFGEEVVGGRSWWRASKGCCCGGHGAQGRARSVSSGGAGGGRGGEGRGAFPQCKTVTTNDAKTWNVVTLLQLVEVATDNRFFTAQLITSLWLLIFLQFKDSSPEWGDADIWYCLYSTTARQRVRGGPSCSSQRSGATLSFGSKTRPQRGVEGGSVAAAAAAAAAAGAGAAAAGAAAAAAAAEHTVTG